MAHDLPLDDLKESRGVDHKLELLHLQALLTVQGNDLDL